jgi:peptidoglycan/LPS O-acetylase OafA/YrhL
MNKLRYYNLDYLRGLMSLVIMVYHYNNWLKYPLGNISLLNNRLSYYGVSIFFIISGVSLYVTYKDYDFMIFKNIKVYLVRRVARIYPLLIVTILLSLIYLNHYNLLPSMMKIMMNLTGAFAIFDYSGYIATGSWSIGNELCFYILFPFILLIKKLKYIFCIYAVSLVCVIYYSFFLQYSWTAYINPMNQFFYFMNGIVLGIYVQKLHFNRKAISLGIVGMLIFLIYPIAELKQNEVMGWSRIILGYSSILIVVLFVAIPSRNVRYKLLFFLGEKSYGIYLIHPIVFHFYRINHLHINQTPLEILLYCSIWSLLAAAFSYKWLEAPFMKLSKKYF